MESTYVWGAGYYGVLAALECEQKGIKVAGFIDSNANQIKTRLGLPVLALEQLSSKEFSSKPQVIIAVKDENAVNEIKVKLAKAGYSENKNFTLFSKINEFSIRYVNLRYFFGTVTCVDYIQVNEEFFQKNQDRVKKIASLLSDDESKEAYLKIVKFKQTLKFEDFPAYNKDGYFRNSFFEYGSNEVFIDCGAFNGDTIEEFLSMNVGYGKIIAFEPDMKNYKILENKFAGGGGEFMLINAGTYNKDCDLYFSGSGTSGSISETPKGVEGEISVKVRSIDGLHLLEKVTFIKMDIEGSELNALIGARETILRDKPKLAICIYHSNEDMLRLAEYVHELVPEYKLYVRHNKEYPYANETVLYATV
jgi:FkbM family methyltransferase